MIRVPPTILARWLRQVTRALLLLIHHPPPRPSRTSRAAPRARSAPPTLAAPRGRWRPESLGRFAKTTRGGRPRGRPRRSRVSPPPACAPNICTPPSRHAVRSACDSSTTSAPQRAARSLRRNRAAIWNEITTTRGRSASRRACRVRARPRPRSPRTS